ncbi:MAG: hypothetical protein PHF37_06540 [Phycisphaerae bacterium]|nr:hypothetical protein [Phycisphaerae bacterium]
MASKAKIVQELMIEFGKTNPIVREEISRKVDEVVIDLLSQNQSRFKGLEATQQISLTTARKEYALKNDFASAQDTFYEVDSEGNYVAECNVISKKEIFRRRTEGGYAGYRLSYIERINNVWTLVLAEYPDQNLVVDFDYFRKPNEGDIDIIRNDSLIKDGVRGLLPQYCPRADYHQAIYEQRKTGFKEEPERYTTHMQTRPSRRIERYNRRMRDIGQGG